MIRILDSYLAKSQYSFFYIKDVNDRTFLDYVIKHQFKRVIKKVKDVFYQLIMTEIDNPQTLIAQSFRQYGDPMMVRLIVSYLSSPHSHRLFHAAISDMNEFIA